MICLSKFISVSMEVPSYQEVTAKPSGALPYVPYIGVV